MRFFFSLLSLCLFAVCQASPPTFFPGIGLGQNEIFAGAIFSRNYSGERHRTPAHAKTITYQENYLLTYGLLPDVFAISVIPYSQIHQHTLINNTRAHRKSSGLGDVIGGFTWKVYGFNDIGLTSRILITLGVQAPTGSFHRHDSFGTLPRTLQPGTGNWSLPIQGYYIFQNLRNEIIVGGLYNKRFKGHGFRFGDNATCVFSWNPTLLPWKLPKEGYYSTLLLDLELDIEWAQRNKDHGSRVQNSGGYFVTFIPSLRYNHKYFTIALSYIHPVHSRLNHAHGLPKQLIPKRWHSWAFEIGGRY